MAHKQAEAEARQQLKREEKEQQARLKREEEHIQKEMAKIRRAMEEEKKAAKEKLDRYAGNFCVTWLVNVNTCSGCK